MRSIQSMAGQAIPSFALYLAFGPIFALQSSAVTRQIPEQQNGTAAQSSGKNVTAQTAPAVEVINGNSRVITNFNANSNTARPATGVRRYAKPASAGTSVEVINGSMERTVVLNAEPSPASIRNTTQGNAARHPGRKRSATAHRKFRAGVIPQGHKHATSIETPVSEAKGPATERRNLPPNVIGIASGDSRSQQGKSKPVVIGIAASGAQAAGSVEPVAVGVAPRPAKRRPYRPAALDAQ